MTPGTISAPSGIVPAGDQKTRDIGAALSVLGYSPSEINAALGKLDLSGLSVEEAIREVLKGSLR